MDKIAVLIPCYNEEKTIEKVVKDAHEALPEAVIYVYDNNSCDRTVELASKAGAVIRYERKQGKGNVIRRMLPIHWNMQGKWQIKCCWKDRIWWLETDCPLLIIRRTSAHFITWEMAW